MRTMISFQCETQEEAHAVLSAVAAIGKEPHACSKQYVEPQEVGKLTEKELLYDFTPPKQNVSPGLSTIGKIGTATKEYIFEALKKDIQPEAKYAEHMKLLWARGEIKFDGLQYYL